MERNFSLSLISCRPTIVSKWQTNCPLKCWPLISQAGLSPTGDWLKDSGLSAFSSFIREFLERVIKPDQNVDDIGIAVNYLRATLECIKEAGLRPTVYKCHFGETDIDFLDRTITPETQKPQKERTVNFLEKTIFPKFKKG